MTHPPTALQGIQVLDLSRVLAGPWCTQILGDLGAKVIKIERPGPGDDTRSWGPPWAMGPEGSKGASAYYLCANRNKLSVTCDLAHAKGQEMIRTLVKQSHVLVENFKVGDMARYGLDYASLRSINPSLVYCSITGFGQEGPHAQKAGYDYAIQAMGGLMSITGETDALGGGPQKVGVAVVDLFTGVYASTAILAALRHAELTGQGQYIDIALLDTQIAMLANVGANHLVGGTIPGRMGNAHANIVPYQVFEVAADSQGARDYLVLAVGNDEQFQKCCQALALPEVGQDAKFSSNAARIAHRDVLTALLQAVFIQKDKAFWLHKLQALKVPCSAINSIPEVFADPHITARSMVDTWPDPHHSELHLAASPLNLSITPVRKPSNGGRPPPMLGEHTEDVLKQAGYEGHTIEALRSQGVIAR